MSADNAFFTAGCTMSMREMPRAHENSGLRNLFSLGMTLTAPNSRIIQI